MIAPGRLPGGVAIILSLIAAVPFASAGEAPASGGSQDCVEAEIGNDRASSLGCLNQNLERLVERTREAPSPAAPIDARSPSNVVGVANDAAAREKMGDAFGKSATPQRPQTIFTSPLLQMEHH